MDPDKSLLVVTIIYYIMVVAMEQWYNPHLAFISCREELERGEAVDFNSLDLVGCGVHLSHHDVCVVLVFLSQLIPDRSQLFAVTAPGSI